MNVNLEWHEASIDCQTIVTMPGVGAGVTVRLLSRLFRLR
jgi:hypothetical protein